MERFRFASKTCLSMLVVIATLACGCFADVRSRTCVSSADCLQNEGETCVDGFCVFESEGSPDLEDSFDLRNSPDLDDSRDSGELSDAGDMSPCIELGSMFDFGSATIGSTTTRTLIVKNCSGVTDLVINGVSVCTIQSNGTCDSSDPTFALASPVDATTVAPEQTFPLGVEFIPTDGEPVTGRLTIVSNDQSRSPLTVELSGSGTANECPTAVAEGRVASSGAWDPTVNTAQFETVELRGTSSSDEDGTVQSYEWTVTERPNSHTRAEFSPSNDSPTPSVFLDRAGVYVFELSVFDDQGLQSCSPAKVTVTAVPAGGAVPDTGIYVVLTWGTFLDPDPTNGNGTDLDLHFLHPDGDWSDATWDLNWSNQTPDWGQPGPDGDPVHSGDVSQGWGPETVTLEQPENDTTYSVGVNYLDANGYGPSDATVRVFVDGEKILKIEEEFMEEGQFWYVLDVNNDQATFVNRKQSGFPPP